MSQPQQDVSQQLRSHQVPSNGQSKADVPDPEVTPPIRRRFTATYKQRILDEAERCTQPGELGALLRREGLYSSHLTRWRAQQRAGQLEPQRRGRKADPQAAELVRLQRENQRLKAQWPKARYTLERAELIIDAQKKLCQLFPEGEVHLNLPGYPEDESA
ncbi:MAG: transposase [Anaerolineae bacterium]